MADRERCVRDADSLSCMGRMHWQAGVMHGKTEGMGGEKWNSGHSTLMSPHMMEARHLLLLDDHTCFCDSQTVQVEGLCSVQAN